MVLLPMSSIIVSVTGQALLHRGLDLSTKGSKCVGDVLSSAHLSVANLEATVETEGAWPTKTKTLHLTNADGVASLKALGVGVLVHANNHAFDLGPPGIARTRAVAESHGMHLTGSGLNREQAARAAIIRTAAGTVAVLSVDLGPQPEIVYASADRAGINPLRIRRIVQVPSPEYGILQSIVSGLGDDRREAARAAVGYRTGHSAMPRGLEVFGTTVQEGASIESRFEVEPDDLASFTDVLAQARKQAEIVIVALHNHHWDPEWSRVPTWVMDLSRRLIDEGADLIVGTGAPVLQGIGFHRGKPVLAGLGNFIFHTRRSEVYDREGVDVWTGAVCRCEFDVKSRECRKVEILPIAVGRPASTPQALAPSPFPLDDAAARRVFDAMTADLEDGDRARVARLGERA
ncbi:CapA family protein [Microvirga sp. 2TAF3]|uniref:CapA family protein n=1 Tax=Microvirga sp. 2TAF3 TaxID=3233014 RepID=UPI003F9BE841